ncbi:MAG: phosphotransferase [Streptosporangiaceae bacterium]
MDPLEAPGLTETDLLVPVPFRTADGKLTTGVNPTGRAGAARVLGASVDGRARVASRMRRVMSHLGEDAANVGLIHAGLHLGNALFWRDEVRVIDFDDCGFGY